MTDRIAGFVVSLAENLREDDAQETLTALRMIRGVVRVEPVVADPSQQIARSQAGAELLRRFRAIFEEVG